MNIFALDTYYLFNICIRDDFGEIQIFRKGRTVLVKYHCLIWAMGFYAEDLNLVQYWLIDIYINFIPKAFIT